MILQVKYGLIRLVNTQADLCEQVGNIDMECPIKKGKSTITKDVDLPKEIPPVSLSHCCPSSFLLTWYHREPTLFSQMSTPRRRRRSYAWKQPSLSDPRQWANYGDAWRYREFDSPVAACLIEGDNDVDRWFHFDALLAMK